MRFSIPFVAALALVSGASGASAQDYADPHAPDIEIEAADMADRLTDPAFQQELSATLGTLSQILLDLPLAPLAEAAADFAGEEARDIDPDLTLRKMAPEAGEVPGAIERELPRAMDRMASMAGAIESMAPALREAARAMEDALARAAIDQGL
jgi:hypothetical protein